MKFIMECEAKPGESVKQVLRNRYDMSSALVTSLKKHDDGILVNGVKKYVNYILQEGDKLTVTFTEAGSTNIEPVYMPLEILYEDKWLLAVYKPEHMAVHVSHGNVYDTLANGVLYHLNKDGEEHTFHVATRLDKNTSGVVIIAKNGYIHDMLSKQLRNKTLYKEYIALIEGILEKPGEVKAPIARENESIIKRCVRDDGDEAFTEYRVIENGSHSTMLELIPHTGRTHQLRVHMSHIGHPMVGDTMYGAAPVEEDRHFLHCKKVIFKHPVTKQGIEIERKEPECFWQYLWK